MSKARASLLELGAEEALRNRSDMPMWTIGRYGGLLASVVFASAIAVVGALRPNYSHVTQLVSELGETGGSHAALFNFGGFLPTGLLVVVFAFALKTWLEARGLGTAVAALVGIHGMGMVAAAWVSCDTTCHPASPTSLQMGHDLIAGIKFPCLIAAVFLLSRKLRTSPDLAWLARLSSVVGVASLLFMIAFVSTVESRAATGMFQRAFLMVLYAWLSVLSVTVGKSSRVSQEVERA